MVQLAELQEHGHEVTAIARDETQAETLVARGATAPVVDLYDRPTVVRLLGGADGAVHTASPGGATSADLDSAVVDAAIDAFAGSGKPYVHLSGLWIYGANSAVSEESPFTAPPLVSWKLPIQALAPDGSPRGSHLRRDARKSTRASRNNRPSTLTH